MISVPRMPGLSRLEIADTADGLAAIDLILENIGKVTPKFSRQKRVISLSLPGSWVTNWLQGKPSTVRPCGSSSLVQALQPGILRGEAAMAGGVDDQQHPAAPFRQRGVLAVQQRCGKVVDGHGGHSSRLQLAGVNGDSCARVLLPGRSLTLAAFVARNGPLDRLSAYGGPLSPRHPALVVLASRRACCGW